MRICENKTGVQLYRQVRGVRDDKSVCWGPKMKPLSQILIHLKTMYPQNNGKGQVYQIISGSCDKMYVLRQTIWTDSEPACEGAQKSRNQWGYK